ncbi:MAG TPA: bifunctional class I SAM-dependent methyltransferase/glycosyltransferase family 2 protein [Candidatus Aquicultoraceae bacterium]|nr:bifunctional class I SAM-dependent methyltransferase/glycosyltransferase family 2 protein [Candidatus Aquicultoraceae bacterium]
MIGKRELIRYLDEQAPRADAWSRKNRYYHEQVERIVGFHVPPGSSVLEIGCGTGDLLASLSPSKGVGIDLSPAMVKIARSKFPFLVFLAGDAEYLPLREKFDYVVLSDSVGYFEDVQRAFEEIRAVCHPRTRVVVTHYNYLWEPILLLGERYGLKRPLPEQSWLTLGDFQNLLDLAGFQTIRKENKVLLPVRVPYLSALCNRGLANLPLVNRLALVISVVARPVPAPVPEESLSCSVIIPARNECGNIEAAVARTPKMGVHTEIIFVEGNSADGTAEEIRRVIAEHPDKDIRLLWQGGGIGKGDAVRKGFAAANGDVLMILDADLTVPPEELPKFLRALASGSGEFINGSRLVYPMEKQAMRFLNNLANKFFSVAFTWLLDQRFKDTLCGTKVLYRKDYEKIAAGRDYFGDFDPFGDFDLIFGAAKLNLDIAEVPVRYRERTYGTTQISRFRHGWLLLRMTLFAARKIKFA